MPQVLTAVDGRGVKTLISLAEASYLRDRNGRSYSGWRFHTHFDIDRRVPTRMEVTVALNGGKTDEKHVLRQRIESDHCYVMDRWYGEFRLFNEIVAADSCYVCRIRDSSNLNRVLEERPLSQAARNANVLGDMVVELGVDGKANARPDHRIRVVLVRATPHEKRGGRNGGEADRPATESCGSPRTCSTCRPKSSPTCIGIAGRSTYSPASSSAYWAADIC